MKTIEIDGYIENGWANIELLFNGQEHTISTSYVFDGLEYLLSSLILLKNGIKETECSLIDEPGTHIFHFLIEEDSLIFTCYYSEKWKNRPISDIKNEVEERFKVICSLNQFSKQLILLFTKWENEYKKDGYQTRWRHPFPKVAIQRLKDL